MFFNRSSHVHRNRFAGCAVFFASFWLLCWAMLSAGFARADPPIGWQKVPDTKFKSLCPDPKLYPGITGATGCSAVTAAWNSGVHDKKRNQLVFWGGGHNDYYGNEIYAYEIDSRRLRRLKDPAYPVTDFNHCADAIGNPPEANSRHTYAGMAYIESTDQMFQWNGPTACGRAVQFRNTWLFDFPTKTWMLKHPSGSLPADGLPASYGISTVAYDPVTDKVYVDIVELFAYDPHTDSYERFPESREPKQGYHSTAVIDPKRHKYIIIGAGTSKIIDITPGVPHRTEQFDTNGANSIVNTPYPGLAYHPVIDKIVAWNGGDRVYTLDVDKRLWTARVYPGGPAAAANGTFGRFVYSEKSDLFVEVSQWDEDVHTLKLSDPEADAASGKDFVPPLVKITSPATGATLSGIVTLSADASDNVKVDFVQFMLNGSLLGAELHGPPYRMTLSTTLLGSATHTLTAVAHDVAGYATESAPVTIHAASPATASTESSGGNLIDLPCGFVPAMTVTTSNTIIDGHGCAIMTGLAQPDHLGVIHIAGGVNNVVIRNLKLSLGNPAFLSHNRACLRPQGTGLTLENVQIIWPCGDGALSGRDSGDWIIRNSHLDQAGGIFNEGHGIYHCSANCRPGEGSLVIENSSVVDCRYKTASNGEAVKTRGAHLKIANSVLGANSVDSNCDKAVSMANGGDGQITDSVLLTGPSSDSDVAIGYGAEARCVGGGRVGIDTKRSDNRICVKDGAAISEGYVLQNEHPGDMLIERSILVCDRKRGPCRFAVMGPHKLTIKDSMVVGFREQSDKQFFVGVDGGRLNIVNTRFCTNRTECGLPPWPTIPSRAGLKRRR